MDYNNDGALPLNTNDLLLLKANEETIIILVIRIVIIDRKSKQTINHNKNQIIPNKISNQIN